MRLYALLGLCQGQAHAAVRCMDGRHINVECESTNAPDALPAAFAFGNAGAFFLGVCGGAWAGAAGLLPPGVAHLNSIAASGSAGPARAAASLPMPACDDVTVMAMVCPGAQLPMHTRLLARNACKCAKTPAKSMELARAGRYAGCNCGGANVPEPCFQRLPRSCGSMVLRLDEQIREDTNCTMQQAHCETLWRSNSRNNV